MSNENTPTTTDNRPAVGGPVERMVRHRAWAIFVDSGNARMWSTLQPHVQKLADAEGLTVTPLYDQSALDAAVAAERKKTMDALKACLEGAVMSKYVSKAECEAARAALRNAMLDVWGA